MQIVPSVSVVLFFVVVFVSFVVVVLDLVDIILGLELVVYVSFYCKPLRVASAS